MAGGMNNRLLDVDLSSGTIRRVELDARNAELYLGGRGLGARLLYDNTAVGLDPFAPEMALIFSVGPLTGTAAPQSNRFVVTTKSPLTGGIADSHCGGDFATKLKYSGHDAVIIRGAASKPVYLVITEQGGRLEDASHLWGKGTADAQAALPDGFGKAVIGPAGENRVRYACIVSGRRVAGRGGIGAVMGSKKLKAVAVRGTKGYAINKPKEYLNLLRETNRKATETGWGEALSFFGTPLLFKNANTRGFTSYKYHQLTTVGDVGKELYAENLVENYSRGMVSCYGCPIHCRHRYEIKEGSYKGTQGEGPEYASITAFGPTLGNLQLESVLYLSELCNKYGIDTISGGNYLGYIFTLYEKGIITKSDVGYELKWGGHKAIESLLMDTIYRRNFGDIVAEGSFAFKRLTPEAKKYLLAIKNVSIEQTDERAAKALAFGLGVATRGTCHMRSRPSVDVVSYPRGVLNKFYGGDVGKDFKDYEGKAKMVWWHELFNAVVDSVGICRIAGDFSSINPIVDIDISKLLETAIDFNIADKDLLTIGERIYTAERLFLANEGITRKDDYLPDLYYETPVPDGPSKGEYIDRKRYDTMLDEYYMLHGWRKNGIPTKKTIDRLKLRGFLKKAEDENKSK